MKIKIQMRTITIEIFTPEEKLPVPEQTVIGFIAGKPAQVLWDGTAWRNLYGQLIAGEVTEWYVHKPHYFDESKQGEPTPAEDSSGA